LHLDRIMPDDFTWHPGQPAETGRLRDDSRPAAALPMNALRRESFADPSARSRYRLGTLTCEEIGLEPPESLPMGATLAQAARKLGHSQAGWLPLVKRGRLAGALYLDDLLKAIGVGRDPAATPVGQVRSRILPTVALRTLLVDAVRLMLATFVRRAAVVDDQERLLGFVTLSEAASLVDRDPAVREVLAQVSFSPSLWARRFR
jgi:CBS domain-containing protein